MKDNNLYAILGIVFAFVFAPLGIVFSILGKKRAQENNGEGEQLAKIGLILSIVITAIAVIAAIVGIVMAASVANKGIDSVNKVIDIAGENIRRS